jgi:hypothetical protein
LTDHFLYQKRHWQQGYAKALRNHWYCGAYIPQFTLHRAIHSKLHDVPVPNGKDCKRAYEELIRRENEGAISKDDTPMQRLAFLIEMFSETCPATTAILVWQLQIVTKFFDNVP